MTSRIHKKAPWHGGQEAKYPNVKSFDSGTIPNGTQDLIILFAHNKFRVHRSSRGKPLCHASERSATFLNGSQSPGNIRKRFHGVFNAANLRKWKESLSLTGFCEFQALCFLFSMVHE